MSNRQVVTAIRDVAEQIQVVAKTLTPTGNPMDTGQAAWKLSGLCFELADVIERETHEDD